MQPLTAFTLPLETGAPPAGYSRSECAVSESESSKTSAFETGLNERDIFFGQLSCVICGTSQRTILEHCHIIPKSEPDTWTDLQRRGWLPQLAKDKPHHEPRNGLTLCRNHHGHFDAYKFFIRFLPDVKKFVMINYSNLPSVNLRPYHGKAIALDIADKHAPFPSLLIIHEMRVRGHNPFQITNPDVPDDNAINWQGWIETDGVWDNTEGHFHRRGPHDRDAPGQPRSLVMTPMTTHEGGGPSAGGTRRLELNEKVIADILAATRAMPSWKECEMEGTRWTGTAEENTQKYLAISRDS